MENIPFFMHDLGKAELDAIAEVLKTPILTTGDAVRRAERLIAEYLGIKYAVAVNSCTGALHLSLLALGVGPGDEVITTPMTFIATSTAILEAGAEPVFVDVEPETGNLDANRIESAVTPRTKAIIPVHLYGQICDMRAIRAVADKHGLKIIEDAAHCIEGERDGLRPAHAGDTACFSFYATKNLTCGEGGMAVTNDAKLADRIRLLTVHGMSKTAYDRFQEGYKHWDMIELGWKYNMSNIQAAMLIPQMDRLESSWKKRKELAEYYYQKLDKIPGVRYPQVVPGSKHCHHLFTVWVAPEQRDRAISELLKRGVNVAVNYRAIHLLTYFRETFGFEPGQFPNAEKIGDCTISLPFYPTMPLHFIDYVTDSLREILQNP